MKKKILAIITTVFMVLSLAGCNTQGLSLSKELQKTSAWEAITETGDIDLTLKAGGENVRVIAEYEAFTNQKEVQGQMVVFLKSIEVAGQKMNLTQGQYKFSPVQMYMDGFKFYLSTSYITDLCRIAGTDVQSLVDTSKKYIAFDLSEQMEAAGVELDKLADESASYEIYEKMDTKLPINKDDRKYTINLNSDQMVEVLFNLVNETFTTQEVTLRATYKAMGLSDKEIDEMLAQVKEVYGEDTKKQVKPIIEGSTAQISFKFSDNRYTTGLYLDLKAKIGEEDMELLMDVHDTVREASKKTINFPTSVSTYTMQDLENLMLDQMAAEN